eukprot:9028791-Pyramimonas_sp.AAC.1
MSRGAGRPPEDGDGTSGPPGIDGPEAARQEPPEPPGPEGQRRSQGLTWETRLHQLRQRILRKERSHMPTEGVGLESSSSSFAVVPRPPGL